MKKKRNQKPVSSSTHFLKIISLFSYFRLMRDNMNIVLAAVINAVMLLLYYILVAIDFNSDSCNRSFFYTKMYYLDNSPLESKYDSFTASILLNFDFYYLCTAGFTLYSLFLPGRGARATSLLLMESSYKYM